MHDPRDFYYESRDPLDPFHVFDRRRPHATSGFFSCEKYLGSVLCLVGGPHGDTAVELGTLSV
eukprot:5082823-Prorocentrum_lima.AAC.1